MQLTLPTRITSFFKFKPQTTGELNGVNARKQHHALCCCYCNFINRLSTKLCFCLWTEQQQQHCCELWWCGGSHRGKTAINEVFH